MPSAAIRYSFLSIAFLSRDLVILYGRVHRELARIVVRRVPARTEHTIPPACRLERELSKQAQQRHYPQEQERTSKIDAAVHTLLDLYLHGHRLLPLLPRTVHLQRVMACSRC